MSIFLPNLLVRDWSGSSPRVRSASSWMPENYNASGITLRTSKVNGLGMFAQRTFETGTTLMNLSGMVVPVSAMRNQDLVEWEWNALSDSALLVRRKRTPYYYLNHSRSPNARIHADGFAIVALHPVQPGEELTLNYLEQPLPKRYLRMPGSQYL